MYEMDDGQRLGMLGTGLASASRNAPCVRTLWFRLHDVPEQEYSFAPVVFISISILLIHVHACLFCL
jgi:hypothetical protein